MLTKQMLEVRNQFCETSNSNEEKSDKEGKETWYYDLYHSISKFCGKEILDIELDKTKEKNERKDIFHPALLAFQEKERIKEIIID